MKFMTMVKATELPPGEMPPFALMEAIAKLGQEAADAGVFAGTGGLLPTALGARVALRGGQVAVSDGPFAEAKEVVGGFAFYECKSKEEAIEWSLKFINLHKEHWPGWEGEVELRQVMEGPDFGAGPGAEQVAATS